MGHLHVGWNANAMEIETVNKLLELMLTDKFGLNENFTCRLTISKEKLI